MKDIKDLQSIVPILKQNDVEFAGIFGSRARGDGREDSDLDLLVRFSKPVGFIKLIHLENELTKVLNTKVDLLTEGSINRHIRPFILRDLKTIYGIKQAV